MPRAVKREAIKKEEGAAEILPPAKRPKRDYNDTISVLVGASEHPFTIHTARSCEVSTFFKATSSEQGTDGKICVVRLQDHEPQAFEIFVHWMYSGKIEGAKTFWENDLDVQYISAFKVWMLARHLGCEELQTCMVDHLLRVVRRYDSGPSTATLQYIWDNTLVDSGIRRLMTDATARKPRDKNDFDELPAEITHEVQRLHFERMRSTGQLVLNNRARYLDSAAQTAARR